MTDFTVTFTFDFNASSWKTENRFSDHFSVLSLERCCLYSTDGIFHNEDRSLFLVGSGTIYNYAELRTRLQAAGHVFYTDKTHEIIIHLYEEYGDKASNYLRGTFVYVLYDKSKNRIFASRDRMGELFLYYAVKDSSIILSTDLKSIVRNFIAAPKLNLQSIADSIGYSYPMGTATLIDGILKLPQAANLSFEKDLKIAAYWKKEEKAPFPGDMKTAEQSVLAALREAVNLTIQNNKSVAILLSGGVDSSTIAALARENCQEVHALTIGYKGNFQCDEREIAKRFAAEKNLIWHEIELTEKDYQDTFEEYTSFLHEPVCDIAAFAQWNACKKAKELGFDVLLCGNGPDEIFYGYAAHNHVCNMLELLFQPNTLHKFQELFKAKNIMAVLRLFRTYKNISMFLNSQTFLDIVHCPAFRNDLRQAQTQNYTLPARSKIQLETLDVTGFYNWLLENWLINNCSYLGNQFMSAWNLEIRSPFLDHKLCELIFSLPLSYKYDSEKPKIFLKRIMSGIVPEYILNPAKRGFTPPAEFISRIVQSHGMHSFNELLTKKVCESLTGIKL